MASPFPGGFIFCGGRWPGAEGFRRSAAARRLCPGRLPRRPAVRAESGRSAAPRFLRQNSMTAPVSPTVTVTSRPM